MELLLAILVVLLSVGGLSLGLLLKGRGPVTACEAQRCLGTECATCQRRPQRETKDA